MYLLWPTPGRGLMTPAPLPSTPLSPHKERTNWCATHGVQRTPRSEPTHVPFTPTHVYLREVELHQIISSLQSPPEGDPVDPPIRHDMIPPPLPKGGAVLLIPSLFRSSARSPSSCRRRSALSLSGAILSAPLSKLRSRTPHARHALLTTKRPKQLSPSSLCSSARSCCFTLSPRRASRRYHPACSSRQAPYAVRLKDSILTTIHLSSSTCRRRRKGGWHAHQFPEHILVGF